MKKQLTLYQKILLGLMIALPVIILIDVSLQYLFDISLIYGFLVVPWIIAAPIALYVFFSQKKIFALVVLSLIVLPGIGFYDFTKHRQIRSRRSISKSDYSIAIETLNYSIIKDYGFAEKTVAVKYSTVFFDPDSKTGVSQGYRLTLLKDTPDSLYIEINSGEYRVIDSLKKRSLWGKD